MKLLYIILASGLGSGIGGFVIGDFSSTSRNLDQEKFSESPASVRTNKLISRGATQSSGGSAMKVSTQKTVLSRSQDIMQLTYDETVALLEKPEFNVNDPNYNIKLFMTCFARLAEINPEEAMEVAKTRALKQRALATNVIFKEWSSVDTDAVLEFALEAKNQKYRLTALRYGLSVISKTDPAKAYDLAKEYDYTYTEEILTNMVRLDPSMATSKAESESEQGMVLAEWLRIDYPAAMEYFESIEDQDAKYKMIGRASWALGRKAYAST